MLVRVEISGQGAIDADKLAALDQAIEALDDRAGQLGLSLRVDVLPHPQSDDDTRVVMERSVEQEHKRQAKEEKARQSMPPVPSAPPPMQHPEPDRERGGARHHRS